MSVAMREPDIPVRRTAAGPGATYDMEETLQPGSAIRRHKLGAYLRQLRLERSLRLEDVAADLGVAPSTLSRIETGAAPTRTSYLKLMLDLYDVDDPDQRKRLADLAREGQRKNWWDEYDDLLPPGADRYLRLEATAAQVQAYSPQAVPELPQTADYAAAAIRASRPGLNTDQVSQFVSLQTRRQQLAQGSGLGVHMIIDETALLRTIAPAHVMTGQLEHLIAVSDQRTATVQVATATITPAVLSPPFTLLSFTGSGDAAIACCHGPGGQVIVTRRSTDVQVMRATFHALVRTALSPARTADLIRDSIHG
jgi:transcriptional regulator with XRE-family HTH domain